jgi:two-component system nitrogen regulation response regulator GlnG
MRGKKMKTVVIADDDATILWVLEKFFREKGFEVTSVKEGVAALERLKATSAALALLDINMPGKNGIEVLKEAGGIPTSVIIMTGEATMKNAIEAMREGAFDYITKPIDLDELDLMVERAFEARRLEKEVSLLKEMLKEKGPHFVGKSKLMERVFKTIGKVAARDVTVLIEGESGTGKELVARLIHANSPRRSGPFVAINSAAVPKDLMEAELFGYEKGAFTGAIETRAGKFEIADTGTVFLDEIADMDLNLQAKLLRAIQEREFYRIGGKTTVSVDLRIIAATNQDLEKAVEEKRFREDLYYRINVVAIKIPPLRDRKDDIALLVEYFLERFREEFGVAKKLSPKAAENLYGYDWPGNVRELENALKKAYILSPGVVIEPQDMELTGKKLKKESLEDMIARRLEPFIEKTFSSKSAKHELYDSLMPFMERPLIKLVLKKTDFNQVKAAEILGINRNTLRKKIRELKIGQKDIKQ